MALLKTPDLCCASLVLTVAHRSLGSPPHQREGCADNLQHSKHVGIEHLQDTGCALIGGRHPLSLHARVAYEVIKPVGKRFAQQVHRCLQAKHSVTKSASLEHLREGNVHLVLKTFTTSTYTAANTHSSGHQQGADKATVAFFFRLARSTLLLKTLATFGDKSGI